MRSHNYGISDCTSGQSFRENSFRRAEVQTGANQELETPNPKRWLAPEFLLCAAQFIVFLDT